MADIVHRIGIRASLEKTYAALATIPGLSKWWTQDTDGTCQVGGAILFNFRDDDGSLKGGFTMRVLELTPGKTVRWVVEKGPDDWVASGARRPSSWPTAR